MFKEKLLENGLESPKQTTLEIINLIKEKNQDLSYSETNDVFKDILVNRVTDINGTSGSLYKKIKDEETIKEFLDGDICTLTFFVLFSESPQFRNAMVPRQYGDFAFNETTEAIHSFCKKNSELCKLKLSEFQEKANQICNKKIYN